MDLNDIIHRAAEAGRPYIALYYKTQNTKGEMLYFITYPRKTWLHSIQKGDWAQFGYSCALFRETQGEVDNDWINHLLGLDRPSAVV